MEDIFPNVLTALQTNVLTRTVDAVRGSNERIRKMDSGTEPFKPWIGTVQSYPFRCIAKSFSVPHDVE